MGRVGQISFWSPNHGLLITGGEPAGSVKAGLYAYDGVEWHQLATVCGGANGRIAWSGPDEFWTIADQRAGQIKGRQEGGLASVSLCHFLDGKVVGSYAMPLGQADSYKEMDAAACFSADDCWFSGGQGSPPNVGAFHLHWDGSSVSAIYDPEDHAVAGMVAYNGRIYEGLAIGPSDSYLPGENSEHPSVIRTISPTEQAPGCENASGPFCDAEPVGARPLPVYPSGDGPEALGGFDLATDGSPLGEGATQLWAAADPIEGGRNPAPVTILREASEGTWTQLVPGAGGSSPFRPGESLSGSEMDEFSSQATFAGNAIAPEPATSSAWLSLSRPGDNSAHVARLEAKEAANGHEDEGSLVEEEDLPNRLDPVGYRGEAGPIACAATSDCWMATTEGWLFHLGGQHERDDDPYFSELITERPPDASVPVIYPDVPPVEELVEQQPATVSPRQAPPAPSSSRARAKPLVEHVKSRFLRGRVLEVSFTLTARAHVQLIGRRKGKVVAHTRLESLRRGRHRLALTLNPTSWPTKLQFVANPIGASAPSGTGTTQTPSSSDTVST